MVTWICEVCDYEYECEEGILPIECPNCGAEADRQKPKPPPSQLIKPPH